MAIYNLQRGRGVVFGLKEIQQRIAAINDAMLNQQAAAVTAEAAQIIEKKAESNAAAANVPHEVLEDIFSYGKQPRTWVLQNKTVTSLVGMRKKGRVTAKAYVTWGAGRQVGKFEKKARAPRSRKALVVPGARRIGENLGTMWEFGTTKMAPRPWHRPAVSSSRPLVLSTLLRGFLRILERGGHDSSVPLPPLP